jgi:predicted PurR-regulated permease PerM
MSKKQEQKVFKVLYLSVLTLLGIIFASPFIYSLFFGGTIALAMYPLLLKLEAKGLSRKKASLLLTTLFTVIISIPLFFFLVKGTLLVTQQLESISHNDKFKDQGMSELVVTLRHQIVSSIHNYTAHYEFLDFLTEKKIDLYMNSMNGFLLKLFSGLAMSLPEVFLLLLIMILCLNSFLQGAEPIRAFFRDLFGFSDDKMKELTRIYIRDSKQVYVSNIATGAIQSLIVALGVFALGLGDFFLVFFVTFVVSFVPVIGAAPVAFVFAAYAFVTGNTTAAIILAVVGSFSGVVDNILRPWLASSGESHCPGIVSFIGVLGGAILLGFPGLFIGLLVSHLTFDTLPLFFKEIGKSDSFFDK